jgi:hypothetical protein
MNEHWQRGVPTPADERALTARGACPEVSRPVQPRQATHPGLQSSIVGRPVTRVVRKRSLRATERGEGA